MTRNREENSDGGVITINGHAQQIGRERRERLSQLAWCGEGCFDLRRRVNSAVGCCLRAVFQSNSMEHPWEDNLLERKVESDLKDLLKTLVAFANSFRPGHIATILIGERDDGCVDGVTSPENIQGRIRKECDKIYPSIIWRSTVYEREGKSCVRAEVEYDGDPPHFGGTAWVRKGASTERAPGRLVVARAKPRFSNPPATAIEDCPLLND